MECNKEDAIRARKLAEEKMEAGDFVGAQKFVTKAQRLFPNLENIVQMITICDVHSSAIKKIKGLDDWYGVLQVQPFADADTIKKQYRKLALLLHPDKNKFASAEAVFKLVGEANRLLSDQIKRSQYDNRYRSHSMLANKHVHAYSGRHCEATNNDAENIASVYTFWTRCRHCGQCYKYLSKYMNTVMYCSSCRKSYVACNMRCDGVPPSSSTAGRKEFQYQGMYNTSRQNASTGAESGGSAAEMGKNGTAGEKLNKKNQEKQKKGAANREPKKDEGCTENDAEGRTPQNSETATNNSAEIPKADVLKPQHQVKKPHTSAAKSIPDLSAPKKNQTAKKKRKAVEESSKSFEVDSSAGAKTDTYEYNKRKSSRKKPQVFCSKGGRDGDFVSPPNKKTKSACEFESEFNTKQTAEDNQSSELADSGVSSASSHAYKGKAKKNEHSGNEDILSCKNKVCEGCDGNGEDAALLSKIGRVEKGYKANENHNPLDVPDLEFSVFDVEWKTEDFAVNQVWSTTTDSRDGMPRKYAQIKNVLNGEFKLRITYLDPVLGNNDESIPVACGKFKYGTTKEVEDRSIFSGQMHNLHCNEIVSIYPRKGEIWAIFREWNAEWNTSLKKHKLPYKYDFVEIVSDFHDLNGVGVAYLGKLKGSVQLFHWEAQNGICQIQFTPKDMLRFSHKVPAVKITGKEKESVPPNSYELDPAALPKDIFQFSAVDMEMDSEIMKGKADGPYPEASKVGAKAKPVPETAPSPRKRRKSDDDNGVCSNLGEVIGGSNRSHIFSSSEVDEKNTPTKSRKDAEATDVFKLRKSPRLQTIPSQQGDEKKCVKQGNKLNIPKKMDKGLVTDSLGVDEKNTPNKSRKNGEATDVFKLRKSPRLQTIPSQHGDEMKSAKQGNKMNTPKKTDKGLVTDSLGVGKSPNGIHQPAESQEGESSKKQGCNGEIPSLSKQNDLPTQLGGSMYESPNTTHVSPNCKTPRRNASDFKNLRSEDKFGIDQIWAIYRNDNRMPSEYVKIKKIETKPKFVIRGTPTELYPPSTEPVTRTVSCGEFKLLKGRPKIFPHASFSHQVKPFDSSKKFIVKVYPRKGDIWALYKNCDSTEEPDIVEVVEDNCDGEIVKVVALTAVGSSSVYKFQRKQGSNVGLIDIPKAEMSRFSHQIPAIRQPKRATRLVEGGYYWELDPIAIPSAP
ncbi:unnamed protein product [Arabidopsis halleri]